MRVINKILNSIFLSIALIFKLWVIKIINNPPHTSTSRSFFPKDACPVKYGRVVLVKSQKAFPGVKESDTDIMRHNNHFQVRNSSETRRALENLYEEKLYDQFFRLTKD